MFFIGDFYFLCKTDKAFFVLARDCGGYPTCVSDGTAGRERLVIRTQRDFSSADRSALVRDGWKMFYYRTAKAANRYLLLL